jgi:hypothetical protein
MVLIGPGRLQRGPEKGRTEIRIDHTFALAAREVTEAEFRRFRKEYSSWREFAPTDDCPANAVRWYDAAYLTRGGRVEDWGCGTAYFKRFVPDRCYCGIDRDPSASRDLAADLAGYTSTTDGIFLRHVLEHDPRWQSNLRNALASFRRRMVLVVCIHALRPCHHPSPPNGRARPKRLLA